MCKNYVCLTSRENSSKSSIRFSTLMSDLLEDSEKPLLTESPRNWSCFALQLLVPYGVYFFIMIMMIIIMMDIA